MNADQAREKSSMVMKPAPESSRAKVLRLIAHVEKKILSACDRGEFFVDGPLAVRMPISAEEKAAIYSHFQSLGYSITVGKQTWHEFHDRISW